MRNRLIRDLYFEMNIWYEDDLYHRESGTTKEYVNGAKEWYQNDKLHRLDGPAVELITGSKYWYYQGKRINCKSQEEFERIIKLRLLW